MKKIYSLALALIFLQGCAPAWAERREEDPCAGKRPRIVIDAQGCGKPLHQETSG